MRAARVIGAIGRTCLTAGVLILLFVAYQLWGTGIREAQAQNKLEDEFNELLDSTSTTTAPPTTGAPAPTTTAPVPPPPPPEDGGAVARIRIPDIGVDKIVVQGVAG